MAIVITNGTYYICLNENGKHRKTEDINKAIQYDSINQAKKYLWAHQDRKTQGYYIYDTEKERVIWKQVVQRKHRSAVTREMLYKQYDGRCQLCGKKLTLDDMTLDHIVPLNLGGADRLENIQIACFACNQLKKNILPGDFLNRVTNVFMYQMEKKCRHNLQWKCIKRLLKTLG